MLTPATGVTTTTRAEIENGTALTGGDDVTVTAAAWREVDTKVEAGTAGGTAITPVVGLVILKDDKAMARIGTSATALTLTGNLKVAAAHTLRAHTEGKAEAASTCDAWMSVKTIIETAIAAR